MNTNTIIWAQLFEYSNNLNICGNTGIQEAYYDREPESGLQSMKDTNAMRNAIQYWCLF